MIKPKCQQKSEYSQLLLDPRWQKKRLEILARDNFMCQSCEDKENTLHVHHCYYNKEKKPWEYENSSLITLCHVCHREEGENFYFDKNALTDALSIYGFTSQEFNELACCVHDYFQTKGDCSEPLDRIIEILKDGVKNAKS